MEEKIKELKKLIKFRDEQQKQLDEDLNRLSVIEKVQVAAVIEGIQGFIRGLNHAINILSK